jgi:hypothetical protein
MQLIEVDRVVRGRDAHTALVAHSQTSLQRGLEFGEPVVLRVGGRDNYAAKVRDIEFEHDDTVYTLDLSVRLPEDLAEERLAGLTTESDLELHEIVDLLGELRRMPPTQTRPTEDALEVRVAFA